MCLSSEAILQIQGILPFCSLNRSQHSRERELFEELQALDVRNKAEPQQAPSCQQHFGQGNITYGNAGDTMMAAAAAAKLSEEERLLGELENVDSELLVLVLAFTTHVEMICVGIFFCWGGYTGHGEHLTLGR